MQITAPVSARTQTLTSPHINYAHLRDVSPAHLHAQSCRKPQWKVTILKKTQSGMLQHNHRVRNTSGLTFSVYSDQLLRAFLAPHGCVFDLCWSTPGGGCRIDQPPLPHCGSPCWAVWPPETLSSSHICHHLSTLPFHPTPFS